MPTSRRADLSKVLPAVKCTARKRNGEPCKAMAARGANVCRVHGGSAPQVKKAARRRLDNAADALVAKLLGFALDGDTGVPPAVALAAIRDALDRAGMTAKTSVDIEIGPKPFEQIFTQLEIGSRAEYRRSVGDDDDGQPDPLAGLVVAEDDDAPLDVEVLSEGDYAARVAARPFVNADQQADTHDDRQRQRDDRTAPATNHPDDRTQGARLAGVRPPVDDGSMMTLTDANERVAEINRRNAEQRRADVLAARETAFHAGHAVAHPARRALPPGRSGR